GSLFVPILAERDGHAFIADAVRAGAVAYLTSQPSRDAATAAVVVADTATALLALGRHARTRLPDRVIGITGSVGKTTVKDLTRAALAPRYSAHANDRSFNNELGVPLTLANAPDDTDVTVVEMGARGRGHIAFLCDVARPTIGIVTAVELAHTELFGSLEEVAAAKSELVEALPGGGVAILNADRPLVLAMASRTAAQVITFGIDATGVDVTAAAIEVDDELRPSFELRSPWGNASVRLPVAGLHQVSNALAAASAALATGVTPEEVAAGLATASISPWRMELRRASSGAIVINDAYNANPASTEAALRSLAALPARRRIAVLGVMAELGEAGPAEHQRIARLAKDLGIDALAVDAPDYGVPVVHGIEGVLAVLHPEDGDAVLVKASRVAGLEVLASALSN
ncbi:MAG TPA: UDP-N-acetylmuramoyl-tripeptide--D-alanyl-D-alanine ligase, partial [Acidimicrobiales bacterium]|nr:UDP-N-acetylmuramoyl-tripeptide--D-alanyl-D-alanine ligase [Acidimicrobiales bacterium]